MQFSDSSYVTNMVTHVANRLFTPCSSGTATCGPWYVGDGSVLTCECTGDTLTTSLRMPETHPDAGQLTRLLGLPAAPWPYPLTASLVADPTGRTAPQPVLSVSLRLEEINEHHLRQLIVTLQHARQRWLSTASTIGLPAPATPAAADRDGAPL